jgi:hypothetical protein
MTSSPAARIYVPTQATGRLSQGEIISGVVERRAAWDGGGGSTVTELLHAYVVVLSQDCDLEQDARTRDPSVTLDDAKKGNMQLAHVLLVRALPFDDAKPKIGSARQTERISLNKDERYHFLADVPASLDAEGQGLPALLLDFKNVFSYPTGALLESVGRKECGRRAKLLTPYAEHLGVRFGHFYQRIGLDLDHHDARPRKEAAAEAAPVAPAASAEVAKGPTIGERALLDKFKEIEAGPLPQEKKK